MFAVFVFAQADDEYDCICTQLSLYIIKSGSLWIFWWCYRWNRMSMHRAFHFDWIGWCWVLLNERFSSFHFSFLLVSSCAHLIISAPSIFLLPLKRWELQCFVSDLFKIIMILSFISLIDTFVQVTVNSMSICESATEYTMLNSISKASFSHIYNFCVCAIFSIPFPFPSPSLSLIRWSCVVFSHTFVWLWLRHLKCYCYDEKLILHRRQHQIFVSNLT